MNINFDQGLFYDKIPEQFNLAEFLLSKSGKNKIIFYYKEETYDRLQLKNLVEKFSYYLSTLSVLQEQRVVILLPDCIELIVAFLGIIWNGSVAVLINEALAVDDIVYIINDCRATTIITNQEWFSKIDKTLAAKVKHWLLTDSQDGLLNKISTLEKGAICKTSRDEPAFWVYTSGSTGKPKGVIHAHYSPVIAAERYAKQTLNLDETDLFYSAPPMAFSYGLGTSLYMPLYLNAAAVISDATNAFGFIETINKFQPTVFFGIPNNFANILSLVEIAPLEASKLKFCVSAGEQLPVSILEKWLDKFRIPICEGIGTTESTHIFISNTPNACIPGSSGKSVPGYHIRIVDEYGHTSKTDEVGTLEITGEGLMLGYWNRLKDTQNALKKNTLCTGDYYRVDGDGNFYFMGRKDNLIKVNGMWVTPTEIENELIQCPFVQEAAVVIFNNEAMQNASEICAFISLKEKSQEKENLIGNIKKILKEKLPKYKIPRKVYFIETLPRTTTGKIHRKQLINFLSQKQEVTHEKAQM